ncbi:MAG: hypothetical protein QNJ36_21975 [Calothrix sp. MO_167.B42]|nr:hypothetical protein [Calothrix sp. MO_167.B42]
MTIAINQPIQQHPLSFDEFLALYGGDNRYELIDGEVFDLELKFWILDCKIASGRAFQFSICLYHQSVLTV